MSDPIRVQVSVKIKCPDGRKPSVRLVREALMSWAGGGELPSGFTVKGVVWGRPGRRAKRATEEDDIEEVVRRLLQRVPFVFSEIRVSRGNCT